MTGSSGQAAWISLAIAVSSALTVIVGQVLANRAKKKHDATEEGLAALQWAQEFEKRTQAAESKAEKAEQRAAETERKSIATERHLAKTEDRMADLADMVTWIGEVIELARDGSDTDHAQLLQKINGGPPAYHRNRR